MIKCVCFSDNHGQDIPIKPASGDVLIIAGDITSTGTAGQTHEALDRIADLKFPKVLLVPGNHDWFFMKKATKAREMCLDRGITLLIDEGITIERTHFYGSPWQPAFRQWAFNLPSPGPIAAKWDLIPDSTDILITHGPLYGVLDQASQDGTPLGCRELRDRVRRLRPRYHVFGHIHNSYGVMHACLYDHAYIAANVSICDEEYKCVNPPVTLFI